RGALRLVLPNLDRADVMRVGAFDVDRHGGDTGAGDNTTHLRVGETTGVVDDHGTRADGGGGHLRLPGVDGNGRTLGDQGLDGGNRPGDLVLDRNGGVLVMGGLPADVDDRGPPLPVLPGHTQGRVDAVGDRVLVPG